MANNLADFLFNRPLSIRKNHFLMRQNLNFCKSGAAAGIGVDFVLFPLDTVKTRLQSKQGFWKSGAFRGIYNGLPSTLLGSAPTSALFFTVYDTTKRKLDSYVERKYISRTFSQIIAANLGEISACLIRVPVDVVKQRAQAHANNSTFQVFRQIVKLEGLKGFYRAYLTTVFREIPFGTIQFPLWEYLKLLVEKYNQKCEPSHAAVCGAIAGGISAALTTPMDVAKTRITLAKKTNNTQRGKIVRTILEIYGEKGIKGLFAGIYPRVTMISIGGFIFFGIYEETKKIICKN